MYPCTQTLSVPHRSFGLLPRLLVLTILFAAELLIISFWLDNASLTSRGGIVGLVGQWGAWTVRGIVGFVAIFLTFAYLKSNAALVRISDRVEQSPIGRGLLAAHLSAMAALRTLLGFIRESSGCILRGFVRSQSGWRRGPPESRSRPSHSYPLHCG